MQALWMIVASLFFACMGVCVKLGATRFSAGELVFYRGLVGMLAMAFLAYSRHVPLRTPLWRLHLLRGLSGAVALLFFFYAVGQLPLATATTLNYTSPIFVALLLVCWFGERLRWQAVAAVLLGFGGVVMLLQPTLAPHQWPGAAAGLTAGLLASLAYLSVRMLGRAGEPETRTVFWFSTVTTLVGTPWALQGGWHGMDGTGIAILLGVGGFAAAAQMALTRAYRLGKTMLAANLSYSTVVFSSGFGMLIWDEQLPAVGWLAIVLIVCSGIAASWTSSPPGPAQGKAGN